MRDIRISRQNPVDVREQILCGIQVPVLKTEAYARRMTEKLYTDAALEEEGFELSLIPYFAWTNRNVTEMTVWFLIK